MAIQMEKDVIKTGFEPAYVLVDSWFICNTFMTEIQKIKIRYEKKLHIIGLLKTNRSASLKQGTSIFAVSVIFNFWIKPVL
jgi:hypothetical protein